MITLDAERRRGLTWAAVAIVVLVLLTFLGSHGFRNLKLTEAGYILSTYLFVAGCAYRLGVWSYKPGVRMYLRGTLKRLLFARWDGARPWRTAVGTAIDNLGAQRFIWKRGPLRWAAHFAISWGCLLSFALTIPLVLGMVKFRLAGPQTYQVVALGIPLMKFPIHSFTATLLFNGLNLSALLMVVGLVLAYINRLRMRAELPQSRPHWDMAPLHMLMVVGLTGLLITVDYKLFAGYSYPVWAIAHQIAVVVLLVWLPWSKLFHVLMRPLAISVKVYQQAECAREMATCKLCNRPFASQQQVDDLKQALGEQGISLTVMDEPGQAIPDRQMVDYCLDCKRLIRARRYVNLEVSLR